MNDNTGNMTDERAVTVRFDRVATCAMSALVVVAAVVGWAWEVGLFVRRWPAITALALILAVAIVLIDLSRPKNIAWRAMRRRYGPRSSDAPAGSDYGAGRGRIGRYSYWGLRCFGYASGVAVVRLLSMVNRPLFLPWSAISTVEAYPNVLTGKAGFENDLEARVGLRDQPELTVEVPWLGDFRHLLPKTVRFRLTKRLEKAGPLKRSARPRDLKP